MKATAKARSPYQRHQKAPYQYSAELRVWQRAARAGGAGNAAAADDDWRRMMSRRGGYFGPEAIATTAAEMARLSVPRHSFPAGVAPFSAQRQEPTAAIRNQRLARRMLQAAE